MTVEPLAAVWDGVGACKNQKVSQKKKEKKKKRFWAHLAACTSVLAPD
jgi:hypothetical protein